MTIYGYARVSTDGQTLDAQVAALTAAGAAPVFRETASGAKTDRRELAKAVRALESGDTLLVTRLDRLARSMRDLLNILDTIAKAGAGFRSLGDAWADTTTPHGRLMLTVLGGLAEFERELIRARTGEGRVRAKARGVHMGRPSKLTPHQKREALKALADGTATQADLARRFNLSSSTISRLAEKAAALPLPIRPALDAETERAARVFLKRLEGKYSIVDAILYGSRARGDHTSESDADIAVILKGERGERRDRTAASLDMAGLAFDVMMETGVMVQGLPLWETELARPETFTNPALINNILREGVHL
jgi:DNA invertase Pin-like site-specific DNA recombinase/predicted nucleotidyltransferase